MSAAPNDSTATTTAERLAAVTDRSAFERLAWRVVCVADQRYASLKATGINAKGETVRSPIDGFTLIPGSSPPHYVFLESTTNDSDLARKWLHDHQISTTPGRRSSKHAPTPAADGDLLKAARMAAAIRTNRPDATFTVVLATNQRVEPQLEIEVHRKASALGVHADIWEQSRLSRVLDTDATGQYLRTKEFGIAVERLSRSYLGELAAKTVARAAQWGDSDTWIPRHDEDGILTSLHDDVTWLHLLAGESGFGKSAIAYRVLRRWIEEGGLGLWIDENALADAWSWEQVIARVLHELAPSLIEVSVRSLSAALGGAPLLLVVDDVNRAARPSVLVRQLASWAATAEHGLRVVVLCPVWPQVAEAAGLRGAKHVRVIPLGRFRPDEARRALGAVDDAAAIADSLGYDPLAIALYREMRDASPGATVDPRRVIESFVQRRLAAMPSRSGVTCLPQEHREAMVALAIRMLDEHELAPSPDHLARWFGQPLDIATREFLTSSTLVWPSPEGERLAYRHDRVRDHLLSLGMRRVVQREQDRAPFLDPFFSEISSDSLIALDADPALVAVAAEHAPLVLAAALSHAADGTAAQSRVVTALRDWLRLQLVAIAEVTFTYVGSAASVAVAGTFNGWLVDDSTAQLAPDAAGQRWTLTRALALGPHQYKFVIDRTRWIHDVQNAQQANDGHGGVNSVVVVDRPRAAHPATWAVCLRLTRCASRSVLDVTDGLRASPAYNRLLRLARLRHGDARSGIDLFASMDGELSVSDELRDGVLAAIRPEVVDAMADEVLALVPRLTAAGRLGAVIQVAHLGGKRGLDVVRACWIASGGAPELLAPSLYACISRGGHSELELLRELIAAFGGLSSKKGGARSEQGSVQEELRLGRCRPSSDMVSALVAEAAVDPAAKNLAWGLFAALDDPAGLESVVRWTAELHVQGRVTGQTYWGMSQLTHEWLDGRRSISNPGARRLEQLWHHPGESDDVRQCAFRLWMHSTAATDLEVALPLLRAVDEDSPVSDYALWQRARLRDGSVEDVVVARFRTSDAWARVVHWIWTPQVAAVVDEHLATIAAEPLTDGHYDLSKLLLRVPSIDARALLARHWPRLRHQDIFVHTAIAVGGDELTRLAREEVDARMSASVLKHLPSHVLRETIGEPSHVDVALLERLLPFVPLLETADARSFARTCRARVDGAWGRVHLRPLLSEPVRKLHFPDERDLMRELDDLVAARGRGGVSPTTWAEEAAKRCDGAIDLVKVVDQWLSRVGREGFPVAAIVVIRLAERRGLVVLEKHHTTTSESERRALEQARFTVQLASLR